MSSLEVHIRFLRLQRCAVCWVWKVLVWSPLVHESACTRFTAWLRAVFLIRPPISMCWDMAWESWSPCITALQVCTLGTAALLMFISRLQNTNSMFPPLLVSGLLPNCCGLHGHYWEPQWHQNTTKSHNFFSVPAMDFLADSWKSLFGRHYQRYLFCLCLTQFVPYWFFMVRRKDRFHLNNFRCPTMFRLQPVVALIKFLAFSMPLCLSFYYRDLLWRAGVSAQWYSIA